VNPFCGVLSREKAEKLLQDTMQQEISGRVILASIEPVIIDGNIEKAVSYI